LVQTSKMLFKRQIDGRATGKDRRDNILEAALRIIGEGGPDAVTFRRVAGVAKAPLSSLTYYFASRDELMREAFRLYVAEATRFLSDLETEKRPRSAAGVVEFILEVTRREFADDPAMVHVEYQLILYAAHHPEIAREFNAYERWMEARLAESLEELGAKRPMDAARTVIDVVRGFEIERLTHAEAQLEDLERRLTPVVEALISDRQTSVTASRRMRRARESSRRRESLQGGFLE
jgi:TetR/AcrR family transcriptional regulator, regulator of biofilm formation and stress response